MFRSTEKVIYEPTLLSSYFCFNSIYWLNMGHNVPRLQVHVPRSQTWDVVSAGPFKVGVSVASLSDLPTCPGRRKYPGPRGTQSWGLEESMRFPLEPTLTYENCFQLTCYKENPKTRQFQKCTVFTFLQQNEGSPFQEK